MTYLSTKKPGKSVKASRGARRTRSKTRPAHKVRVDEASASAVKNAAAIKPQSRVTKQDRVLTLLRQSQGVSILEIMEATGWQAHSVRGFLSGTVKKKLSLPLVTDKAPGSERRYHVAALVETVS